MNLLTIKSANLDHLDAIVELDRVCFGGLWTREGYQRELQSPNSEFLILLDLSSTVSLNGLESKTKEGHMIGLGCFWMILEEAHITILAIDPNYQNQGLGQLLLYSLLENAVQQGMERATLEVSSSNQAALNLYQKFGFKIAGLRKGYYQKTGEDALILWQSALNKPDFFQNLAVWQKVISDRIKLHNWQFLSEGV